MKKIINLAYFYAIVALISGLFYRELTRSYAFVGKTQLGVVHTHLFVLGMFMMLFVYLFAYQLQLHKDSLFNSFLLTYNAGVIISTSMMITRGTLQVVDFTMSKGLDNMLAGISGIGHILLTVGFIQFLHMLRKKAKTVDATS